MTEYEKNMNKLVNVAYPPTNVINPLSAIISSQEKRQLKLAESEKERFVTFYFNGQQELVYDGEDRKIMPSKKVGTYDKAPEMSAREITEAFLSAMGNLNELEYSFVLINFANADMVGHTGNFEATKKGCEVIDECLKKVITKVDQLGGVTIITADHGNAEEMVTSGGGVNTEHSSSPVPLLLIGEEFRGDSYLLQSGILADIAPTVLKLLGISIPSEMTGRPLI
jgi:2,3-bisphosphoglycerate-independent phosphoglycerate mutase